MSVFHNAISQRFPWKSKVWRTVVLALTDNALRPLEITLRSFPSFYRDVEESNAAEDVEKRPDKITNLPVGNLIRMEEAVD